MSGEKGTFQKDVLGAGVSVRVGLSQWRVKKSCMHTVTKHLSYQFGSRF